MSAEPPNNGGDTLQDVEERIGRPVDQLVADDIRNAQDAARLLGVDITADDDEIDSKFRRLATILHPDVGGTNEAFKALDKATNFLKEYKGEGAAQETVREARRQGAPRSPGAPFDREQRQKQYEVTFEAVKLHFIQEITGKDMESFNSVNEALGSGVISRDDIRDVNHVLREEYGIPELTLDDIARVLASLLVTGSITLGNIEFMAEEAGIFQRGGRRGGSGTSPFGRGSRGKRGTGPFGN